MLYLEETKTPKIRRLSCLACRFENEPITMSTRNPHWDFERLSIYIYLSKDNCTTGTNLMLQHKILLLLQQLLQLLRISHQLLLYDLLHLLGVQSCTCCGRCCRLTWLGRHHQQWWCWWPPSTDWLKILAFPPNRGRCWVRFTRRQCGEVVVVCCARCWSDMMRWWRRRLNYTLKNTNTTNNF